MPIVDATRTDVWRGSDLWRTQVGKVPLEGYRRCVVYPSIAKSAAERLARYLTIPDTSHVLMIGAGFNWVAEHLAALKPNATFVSTETSQFFVDMANETDGEYIEAAMLATRQERFDRTGKYASDEAELNPATPQGQATKQKILDMIGGDGPQMRRATLRQDIMLQRDRGAVLRGLPQGKSAFDIVVAEDVFPWLLDNEAVALTSAMRSCGSQCVQFLSEPSASATQSFPNYNWKSAEDWKSLTGSDLIVSANYDRAV